MCCALWGKIRRPQLHTQGSLDYQTKLTHETAARRKVVLRGRETEGSGCVRCHHHSGSACSQGVRTTYISSPCRMFDVISGTTPGLNIAKIDLLV